MHNPITPHPLTTIPADRAPTHAVYTVVHRDGGGRSYWTRIGSAYANRDGSLSITLDALPVNGSLQVRALDAAPEGVPPTTP